MFPPELKQRGFLGIQLLEDVYGLMDEMLETTRTAFPNSLIVVCSDHGFKATPVNYTLIPEKKLIEMITESINPKMDEKIAVNGLDAYVTINQIEKGMGAREIYQVEISKPQFLFSGTQAIIATDRAWKILRWIQIKDVFLFERTNENTINTSEKFDHLWMKVPPFSGNLITTYILTGTHHSGVHGVVIFNGPGVNKGKMLKDATVLDIAPSIYAYLGIPLAKDLDGKVLHDAFVKENLPGFSMKRIKTYGYRSPLRADQPTGHVT